MKTTMMIAAVLAALIVPASAESRVYSEMPTTLLGTWCFVSDDENGTTYKRGQCPADERLTIRNGSYEAVKRGCRWTRGSVNRLGKFLAGAKCQGDGHPYDANIGLIEIEDGELFVQEIKCSGNNCWGDNA